LGAGRHLRFSSNEQENRIKLLNYIPDLKLKIQEAEQFRRDNISNLYKVKPGGNIEKPPADIIELIKSWKIKTIKTQEELDKFIESIRKKLQAEFDKGQELIIF
jgi:hypothetical protein